MFPRVLGQEELNKEPKAEEPFTLGGKGCGHRGECRPARHAALLSALPAPRSLPAIALPAPTGRLIWFSFCLWKIGSNSIRPEERREEGSERHGALPARHSSSGPGDVPAGALPARLGRTLHAPWDVGTLSLPWNRWQGERGRQGPSKARERRSPAKQRFHGQPDTSLDLLLPNLLR